MLVEFKLETKKCASCGKQMIREDKSGLFPQWRYENQESQMKERGVVFCSTSEIDDDYICVECEAAGKASITCALCGEKKPSSKNQESFGDPAVYLCTDCYEKVPAKEWDAKVEELRESHRWDFE